MNWDKVRSIVADVSPLIGTLLGGPAGGAVGTLISSALGVGNSPDAVYAKLQSDPGALASVRELEITHAADLQRLTVQAESNRLAADTARIQAVNATMQSEVLSRRGYWRDAFGYIAAGCFGLEVGAVCYVMIFQAAASGAAAGLVTALTMLWGVPLAVLGVSAWHAGAADRIKLGDTSLSAAMAVKRGP